MVAKLEYGWSGFEAYSGNVGLQLYRPHNGAKIAVQNNKRIAVFALVLSLTAGPALAFDLINPLSVIKSAVETAAEDRSAEDVAKDLKIKTKITTEVIEKLGSEVISINSDVYEQDVMLTGKVEKAGLKSQAGKLTASIEGVKKVYNKILVIKATDEKKGTAEGFVEDSVIETKVNALLLDGKGVNVTNFRWRSVGGKVFLFGRALSGTEKNKATKIVKGIKGVTSVTNLAKVQPKK